MYQCFDDSLMGSVLSYYVVYEDIFDYIWYLKILHLITKYASTQTNHNS